MEPKIPNSFWHRSGPYPPHRWFYYFKDKYSPASPRKPLEMFFWVKSFYPKNKDAVYCQLFLPEDGYHDVELQYNKVFYFGQKDFILKTLREMK